MCKRKQQVAEAHGAYEGETVRLRQDRSSDGVQVQRWHNGFPWWMLWLIWPLIGVLKGAVPVLVGGLATVLQISVPLIPLLLIGLGVFLWWRR